MIDFSRDGGILGFPSNLLYLVDKKTKTLYLLTPVFLETPETELTHRRTILVCQEIGYQVLVSENT